ncbi:MAG: hypothetical protein KC492_10800, partial [Myxococcales bacterium]|nr:hypothetical protein [Myxococcales bacterium]
DRLLQVEGIRHALATGWYEDCLFMSVRTRGRKQNAGRILHGLIQEPGLGGAGGHPQMAGARVPMEGKSERSRMDLRRKIITQLLTAFGVDARHFQRIMTKSSAPKNGESKRKNKNKDPERKKDKVEKSDKPEKAEKKKAKSKAPPREASS